MSGTDLLAVSHDHRVHRTRLDDHDSRCSDWESSAGGLGWLLATPSASGDCDGAKATSSVNVIVIWFFNTLRSTQHR